MDEEIDDVQQIAGGNEAQERLYVLSGRQYSARGAACAVHGKPPRQSPAEYSPPFGKVRIAYINKTVSVVYLDFGNR